MKNKKKIRIILAVLILLVAAVSVAAYMYMRAEKTNKLMPAEVACQVVDAIDGTGEYTTGVHAGSKKTSIQVENTGNIAAYVRVQLIPYWVDADGNRIAKTAPTLTLSYDSDNWIEGSENTFYYKQPVGAGNETEYNLLNAPISMQQSTYKAPGASSNIVIYEMIDVVADAIQSKPAKAVTEAWGVEINNGEIFTVR